MHPTPAHAAALEALKSAKSDIAKGHFRGVYSRIDNAIAALESTSPAPSAAEPVAMETTTRRPGEMIGAVWHELERACAKFPEWPTDPLHALAVLGEEFGELTKDVLQMAYEPGKTNAENVRKEAIQTAAMALRFVASLDTYIYKAGEQHRQDEWKAARERYAESGGLHPCYD